MNPWSQKIAYVVGLIVTDGNLSKDKRHITLTSTDIELLETFRSCLNLKNRICTKSPGGYSKKTCYYITFGNVKFYHWLLSIGITPNKTFTLSSLQIPDKYFADFLRGHIDGDGSIIHYIDTHNSYNGRTYLYNRLYVSFHSASLAHLKWVRKRICYLLNIKGSLTGWKSKKIPNKKIHWTLRFCKKEGLILLKFLYYKPCIPSLIRKRKKAEIFLKNTNDM